MSEYQSCSSSHSDLDKFLEPNSSIQQAAPTQYVYESPIIIGVHNVPVTADHHWALKQ